MFRTILVPIDFSPPSLATLRYAAALAHRSGATLHLVHVVDPVPFAVVTPELGNEVAHRASKRLTELAAQFSAGDQVIPVTVATGKIGDEINKLAREICADLIVMATRGYTGLKYAFFGSTAESVVRQAACPVLVLRAEGDAADTRSIEFRKILVPVDFSECARVGMEYALKFANEFGPDVTLFHAVSLRAYFLGDEYTARAVPPLIAQHNEYAKSEMATWHAAAAEKADSVDSKVAFGSPVDQIAHHVEREKIDLIITSTHGRSGLHRMLIGSTANQILRHADCSVLIVPNRSVDACDVPIMGASSKLKSKKSVRRLPARGPRTGRVS
jgi:nucleotide-binding universal stress UspA family protein